MGGDSRFRSVFLRGKPAGGHVGHNPGAWAHLTSDRSWSQRSGTPVPDPAGARTGTHLHSERRSP